MFPDHARPPTMHSHPSTSSSTTTTNSRRATARHTTGATRRRGRGPPTDLAVPVVLGPALVDERPIVVAHDDAPVAGGAPRDLAPDEGPVDAGVLVILDLGVRAARVVELLPLLERARVVMKDGRRRPCPNPTSSADAPARNRGDLGVAGDGADRHGLAGGGVQGRDAAAVAQARGAAAAAAAAATTATTTTTAAVGGLPGRGRALDGHPRGLDGGRDVLVALGGAQAVHVLVVGGEAAEVPPHDAAAGVAVGQDGVEAGGVEHAEAHVELGAGVAGAELQQAGVEDGLLRGAGLGGDEGGPGLPGGVVGGGGVGREQAAVGRAEALDAPEDDDVLVAGAGEDQVAEEGDAVGRGQLTGSSWNGGEEGIWGLYQSTRLLWISELENMG